MKTLTQFLTEAGFLRRFGTELKNDVVANVKKRKKKMIYNVFGKTVGGAIHRALK